MEPNIYSCQAKEEGWILGKRDKLLHRYFVFGIWNLLKSLPLLPHRGYFPQPPPHYRPNVKPRKELQRSVTTVICVTRDTDMVRFWSLGLMVLFLSMRQYFLLSRDGLLKRIYLNLWNLNLISSKMAISFPTLSVGACFFLSCWRASGQSQRVSNEEEEETGTRTGNQLPGSLC